MYPSRSVIIRFLVIAFLVGSSVGSAALGTTDVPALAEEPVRQALQTVTPSAVQVTLSAAQATTSWDGRLSEPEPFELPLLYLNQQRRATAMWERTLTVQLSGIVGGRSVEIEIVSRHENPVTQKPHRESLRFLLPNRPCNVSAPCTVRWVLDAATTPSDFYRLTLRDDSGSLLWENPDPERPDFVALDTWEIGIEDYAVRVTYGVLFPFARGVGSFDDRLAPDAVHAFIAEQFGPIIVETWMTQFETWGFGPVHPDWDADQVVQVFFTSLPYALYDGSGTYTVSTYADGSPYPERRIWLLSNQKILERYDSLANGFRIVFAHEFFHLVQWNVSLLAGCPTKKWRNVFIEAQATFASSAQYPELELSQDHLASAKSQYSATAQRFLERRLKTSYATLEAEATDVYDAALYWRFLYEQYGGMDVVRAALEEAACWPVDDLPASLDEVMDAALSRVDGAMGPLRPAQDELFEESMVAFAQANYALRLENGRCTAGGLRGCEGKYYDPHSMYATPLPEARLRYRGTALAYDGSIPASYGSDLIEMSLAPDLHRSSVTITFYSKGGRFGVYAWKLYEDGNGPRDPARGKTGVWALTPHPEALPGDCSTVCHYAIPHLDAAQYDRLALIVVRLDAHEEEDPAGAYQLIVGAVQ
jgi:hypothetical protein